MSSATSDSILPDVNRHLIVPLFVSALCVILAETTVTWLLTLLTDRIVLLTGLLTVLLTVTVGQRAWLGIGVGEFVAGSYFGDVPLGLTAAISASVAAVLCKRLWSPPSRRDLAWLSHYLFVTILTVAALAATYGTLSELFGRASFFVEFDAVGRETLLVTLAGFPAVWLVTGHVNAHEHWRTYARKMKARVGAIVLLWSVGSYLTSFVFESLSLVPPATIGRRVSPAVQTGYELLAGGRYVVVLLGIAAVLLLAYVERSHVRESSPVVTSNARSNVSGPEFGERGTDETK